MMTILLFWENTMMVIMTSVNVMKKSVFNNYFHDDDDLPFRMIFMIIYDENCLVFNLPHASGYDDHNNCYDYL